jgi:hypothetical protein
MFKLQVTALVSQQLLKTLLMEKGFIVLPVHVLFLLVRLMLCEVRVTSRLSCQFGAQLISSLVGTATTFLALVS